MGLLSRPSNCPICDRTLLPDQGGGWRLVGGARPRDWFPLHCRSDHRDYVVWKRSKRRLITVLAIATTIILDVLLAYALYIFGIRLPQGRSSGAPFVIMFLPAFFVWSSLLNQWGVRRFRRDWQERGGLPASQTFVQ